MSRRSLRPQLNQIRGWVRQGRTDAWIAHQLDVTVQQIQAFKREQDLEADGDTPSASYEDVDLRAEDDAAIAAELEQEAARKAEEEARAADEAARKAAEEEARAADEAARKAAEEEAQAATEAARKAAEEEAQAAEEAARKAAEEEAAAAQEVAKRERTRRGRARRRSGAPRPLEGTFDHGEEGYGLWLDPAVQDDPVYAEHWAGHRPVEVTIEEDQIVIRRAGGDDDDEE